MCKPPLIYMRGKMSNVEEDVVTRLLPSYRTQQYPVLFIDINTIKHYLTLDVVGGFAFFMLGRLLFQSDVLCLLCNVVATQMLHYVLPTSQ